MYMIIIIVIVLTLMMMIPCCSFGLGMNLLLIKEILRLSIISVDVLFSGEKRHYFSWWCSFNCLDWWSQLMEINVAYFYLSCEFSFHECFGYGGKCSQINGILVLWTTVTTVGHSIRIWPTFLDIFHNTNWHDLPNIFHVTSQCFLSGYVNRIMPQAAAV